MGQAKMNFNLRPEKQIQAYHQIGRNYYEKDGFSIFACEYWA